VQKTIAEIAKMVDGELVGDGKLLITGLSGIKEAKPGDLTFLANLKYSPLFKKTQASAVIVPKDMPADGKTVIRAENPSLAFANVASLVVEESLYIRKGIHETVVIDPSAKLGKDVSVGAYTVIEKDARIGDRTVIGSGCFIGHQAKIGRDGFIHPQVTILDRTVIGERVIVHSGTVIGSDGFGFVNVQGAHKKIPQIGIVEIGDDVEIGACVTIDRARFEKTTIGKGTKVDNLVQIAHNVHIGENCILCGQVGISGSCILEKNVVLAGQVGLAGHLTIGENSVVASGSGVPSSIPPNAMYWGFPAKPHMEAKRVNACVQRLPQYVKTIQELKKRIEELEAKIN